jgi:hypothetical protein
MGESGGFPQVRVVMSIVSPRSRVACSSTKKCSNNVLTNLLVDFVQVRVSE